MPKISVIIPTYNAEKYINESIDSILSQTYKNFEILIIDDNSKDSTLEIIKKYQDERIRIIQGDCKGLAAALNKGIREATGEYIARMDADDVSLPERFEKQIKFLEKNPDISLVGTWQKYIGNDSWIHKTFAKPEQVKIALLFSCDLCHSTVMFRKKDFVDNNLFYDENSPQEDFELWSRAIHVLKFANLQEVLGLYRVTGSSITDIKEQQLIKYEVQITVKQLKKYLNIEIPDFNYELLINRKNVFYEKNTKDKKIFLKRLDKLFKLIEKNNLIYNIYNPKYLHLYLCEKFIKNCHGFYLLYPSSYIKFNLKTITTIFSKLTKTNICFEENFSIIQILGLRLYKKSIEKNQIVRKILGIIKTKQNIRNKQKVLIIRLGAIGDVVHSTIMAQAIKNKHKDVEIHYLTADFIALLVSFSPFVDKVFSFDMKKKNNLFYLISLGLKLRKEKYDVSFNLTNAFRNAFINFVLGAKKNVKRNSKRVHAVDAFYNTALDVFEYLKKPDAIILKPSDEIKNNVLDKIKDYHRPYFVINPGGANDAERQGRIWADNNWIELSNKLVEKYGGTVFVCGSKSEKEYHKIFSSIKNSVLFSGELTLEESAALYSMADIFISGDSGPLHIASALDVKVLGLFGSTSPLFCGPYGKNGYFVEPDIVCRYCGKKKCEKLEQGEKFTPCMNSISVDQVFEKAVEIIEKTEVCNGRL